MLISELIMNIISHTEPVPPILRGKLKVHPGGTPCESQKQPKGENVEVQNWQAFTWQTAVNSSWGIYYIKGGIWDRV